MDITQVYYNAEMGVFLRGGKGDTKQGNGMQYLIAMAKRFGLAECNYLCPEHSS